ncbi:type II and III secretion system protein [Candidatus Dependentiae bacterium]|nr:type II and III secretion system protein [Candidatus Dependentiae bacterium]MBU4387167.1 type II and III secretion system protein [Candidatus Dependentiae bacterium]MCG2755924.1 type II and III secretion system protein [Candidatus Dependentiae bacterium]
MIFYLIFSLLFFISLNADEVFIPTEAPDLSRVPNYVSDMLQEEKDKNDNSELSKFENTVKEIVNTQDSQLAKKADELIKDKDKLNNLLSNFKNTNTTLDVKDTEFAELQEIINLQYEYEPLLNNTISFKSKTVDVKNVIELIGKIAGLNFIIDSSVSGIISNINFENITLSSALKIVLSSAFPRLVLVREHNVLRIMNLKDAVLILKSKYADSLISDFVIIYNAKFSETFKLRVEKMWYGIIGKTENKKGYYLVFDDESKKIFFKGSKSEILEFKNFLKQIDIDIPQIRIDARIAVAAKDFEESFGLQVSGVYNRSASINHGWNVAGFGPIKTDGQGDFKTGNLMDWALNLLPDSASKFLNFPFILGGHDLNTKRLNLVLNAAENKSEIETILKPTLLVNSGDFAEILVGNEVPIETNVQERIEGSLRNIDTISYKDLGMKLKVKPTVTPDNKSVFLDIFVEHSYFKDATFNAKTSVIVMNKTTNKVLLNSGQTTLIGGLISNEKRKIKNGVPILQHIPVIGLLFSGKRKLKNDDQLMIFITPTIV